jgi:hypothetical protein
MNPEATFYEIYRIFIRNKSYLLLKQSIAMKIQFYKWGLAGIAVLATTITLVAWTGGPQSPDSAANYDQDTIPAKKRSKETRQAGDRDFDRELRSIDKANKELSEKDWDKVQRDFDNAMDKIDFDKIQLDIDKAMKSVDWDKINSDIRESMAKVDFDKMNKDWEKAFKSIDFEKLQKEVKESMDKVSKIDMEKMSADLKKAQKEMEEEFKMNNQEFKEQMEKTKKEMEKLKFDWKNDEFDFKKIMDKANEGIEKARIELKGYQEMVYAMETEGLLNTKGDYTIEYNKGEISINGKKQSPLVSEKYRKYFKKDKVSIIKEDGEINIKYGSSNTHID